MQLYIFKRYSIPASRSCSISVLSGPGDEFFVNCSVDVSSFKDIGVFMLSFVVCWSVCVLLLSIAVSGVFVAGVASWMVLKFF